MKTIYKIIHDDYNKPLYVESHENIISQATLYFGKYDLTKLVTIPIKVNEKELEGIRKKNYYPYM